MDKPMMGDAPIQAPRKLHKPLRAEGMKPGEIFLYNCEACDPGFEPPGGGGGTGGAPAEDWGGP